jgi:hypothetical protein
VTAVDRVVAALYARPVDTDQARLRPSAGGIPENPGFYSWWIAPGSIPGVPHHPHPLADVDLGLLYVGIAPKFATSKQTLRSRVLKNHLGGNTGSSTFRFSLASLLLDAEQFAPTVTATKYTLTRDDNRRLSAWQRAHLFLTWCEQPRPWEVEADVIAAMQPPLNLAENHAHPFYDTLHEARCRFRQAARTAG